MDYLLPHHESLRSLDPLDVCGEFPENIEDDGTVQHEHIIRALLSKFETKLKGIEGADNSRTEWANYFGELIQEISYSLHNVGDLDTGFLESMLQEQSIEILIAFRENLFHAAKSLQNLLPAGVLQFLSPSNRHCELTSNTVNALLSHLFLGTVQIPKGNEWGRPGFTAMYRASPIVPSAVTGYLTTLIDHFAKGGYASTSIPYSWTLSTTSVDVSPKTLLRASQKAARINPVVKPIASEPTPLAESTTFVLLSAHSEPGPGPAGTHEERLMGQSPALAITSLICPKLAPNVALVTSAFPVHAAWEGHNRYSRLIKLYQPHERVCRRYMIADAAELDVEDHDGILPDLMPGMVEREIGKLEAAFGGCMRSVSNKVKVEVVPWGCQAFGGNLVIKAQCMMLAGGLAGIDEIDLLVTSDREGQVRDIDTIVRQNLTVGELYGRLRQ